MVSEHYDGVRDRLSALENAMSIVMDAVADIAATPATPAAPGGAAVQVFDPRLIADPGARRVAWESLYAFVDYLNATWGALRSPSGMADYYVRARWWENPLTVAHLSALEASYAEAYVSMDATVVGTSLMLRVLEDTPRVLTLVTGNPAAPWGQSATDKGSYWSTQTPTALGSGVNAEEEEHRRELFDAFLEATNAGHAPLAEAFINSLFAPPAN